MSRARIAGLGLGLVAAGVLAFTFLARTIPGVGQEGGAENSQSITGRATITQPLNAVQLQLEFGLKDTEQLAWEGEVKVSPGRVLEMQVVRAARNATVDGSKFSVRAAQQASGKKKNQQKKQQQKKQQNKQNKNQKKNQKKQAETVTLAAARLRVVLDATPTSLVSVETSRGSFAFSLADLEPGQSKTFLDGNASVAREEAATLLTARETEDDFPVLATAADGTIWLAYVAYKPGPPLVMERVLAGNYEPLEPGGHGDQIRLMRFDGQAWHPAPDVTPEGKDVWRPAISVDGQGNVWVLWAEKTADDWEVFARRLTPGRQPDSAGSWSPPVRITNQSGSDFHTVSATDSNGVVWAAWQAFRNGNYEILVSSVGEEGKWSEPRTISSSSANDWSPAIAADSQGNVYVAWDTYDRGDYDVQLRTVSGETPLSISVANSPRFEARPHLYCDSSDRLWIAYEEGDEQWGKDYASDNNFRNVGLERNPGFALYINRTVRVKCLVGQSLKQPAGPLEDAFQGTLTRNKSVPRLVGDGAGGIWLWLRHHPLAGGGGETWHSFAVRYDGRAWSTPRHLTNSSNILDNRPALCAFDGGVLAVYSGDERTNTAGRDQDDLYSTILRSGDSSLDIEPEFFDEDPAPAASVEVVHANESQDVERLRSFRLDVGGKELRLLRGEFHRHTEYTSHRDQDGLLEDSWRYSQDAASLDWMGNGDHDNGQGHEYMWWQIQKISDLHHNPPHFVAAMTYERSLQYPNGHRNVMMPRRGIRPLPRGNLNGSAEEGTPDTKMLYAYLKHFGGICASHTSGTNMGTDWRDNDPLVEPVVEIYQGHRHNYEHFGAPRSATAETQIGGYRPAGFVWNALEKGYRLGFQSSSDHVSTHMSYAIVFAEDTSRQALIDAFKQRHCYAATDNILLVVRSGEHLMGDSFTTSERPRIRIEAVGTSPITKLHVVRDNKYVYTTDPNEREVTREFVDMDAQSGSTSYYYVRVEQADGNLAWGSPMWITYQ